MNELQIVVNQQQGTITTNFEKVKEVLTEQMEIYKSLEVTEENKTDRKKDIATLRKVIKAVNDKRIGVKKECLKPYEIFEKQAAELVEIINKPINTLDSQVKEFEDKQRLEKKAEINKIFDEFIIAYNDLIDEIGIQTIYDNKWENIGTTMKSIREDITAKLDKIQADVTLIRSMPSEKTEEALKLFWGDLDITKAITMINRYEQQKKEIEQQVAERQKRKQAEAIEREVERARKAEREAIEREKKAEREAAEKEDAIREEERLVTEQRLMGIKDPCPVNDDDLEAPFTADVYHHEAKFKVRGSMEELRQIEMYLNSIGVWFERWDVDGKR